MAPQSQTSDVVLGAYMHHTLNASLIYFNIYSIRSNFYQNIKTTQKDFSWFFCIFTHICSSVISFFLFYVLYEGLYFASASRFDSKSRKHLLARWLNLTSWLSANLGTKVPGEQVYASETKLAYSMLSLLSVFTHGGGEPQCYCIIYLLISFVAVTLGSIHSQFSVFTHWHQQKGLGIIFEYIYYNVLTDVQIYISLIHTLIRLYISIP